MKQVKCENCGASINIEDNEKSTKCKYCGATYVNDKKETENTGKTILNDLENEVKGLYKSFIRSDVKVDGAPARPKVNWLLAIILFCCGVFPGIIYILLTAAQQKEWDDTYLK